MTALKEPPLKDAALPSLGLVLASWLACRCAWLSPAVQQAEAPPHQGDSAVSSPALAPLPSFLYVAATALVVLALLLLQHHMRLYGDGDGGGGAAAAGSIPGSCGCSSRGCGGGTISCVASGVQQRGPQGWTWPRRPWHCGACDPSGAQLQEGNTGGDAAVTSRPAECCGRGPLPPRTRARSRGLAAAPTEAAAAAVGRCAVPSPSASLGTGVRGSLAEQPTGGTTMELLGLRATCTGAEQQPAPPKWPWQPRAQSPHQQPGPQRVCGEGRGYGPVEPFPQAAGTEGCGPGCGANRSQPRCKSARGLRSGAECDGGGSTCAASSLPSVYAPRCGNGAVTAFRGSEEAAAAGCSQGYVARTRLTSTRIKIHGGGVQPEQVAPGYQQRIAAVVAAAGQRLEGVYVRRGCIELVVDSYCEWDGPHEPDSDASPVASALVVPGDLVRALDLPPNDSAGRFHATRVWNHPPAARDVLLVPGSAAAGAVGARSSGTVAYHHDEDGSDAVQWVPVQPPLAEAPIGDGAASTGRESGQEVVLLQVQPWVLSIPAAAFASAEGSSAHTAAGARNSAGIGGAGGRAQAVLSVRVWSPYGAVPEVTVRFRGRFLRARVELTAVDPPGAALPGLHARPNLWTQEEEERELPQQQQQEQEQPGHIPEQQPGGEQEMGSDSADAGANGAHRGSDHSPISGDGGSGGDAAVVMTPRGRYFDGTVELLDPPGDGSRCGDGAGDSRTAGLLLLQAHVLRASTVPASVSDYSSLEVMQRNARDVQVQGTQGCTASRPVPVLWVNDPRVAEELLAMDPGADLSPDELEGLVVDLGIFLRGVWDIRAAAEESRGGSGSGGGGDGSGRRTSSAASRAVAGLGAGLMATAGPATVSCRTVLHLYSLGKHLQEWVVATATAAAAAADDGGEGGCGAAGWGATLERLRSDLAVLLRLLEATREGGGGAGGCAQGGQEGAEEGKDGEEEKEEGCEVAEDEGPVVVASAASQGEASRPEAVATGDCSGGQSAAIGPGLANAAAADVADGGVKAGKEVAAAGAFTAAADDAGGSGGEGSPPGLWSMLCSISQAYVSLYDAGYQAYLADYCASTAHVVDAMGFLSVGGIMLRTWQEEPAWRHRPPAAFLAHVAPPLVTLTTSLVTTTAWWLMPRPAWARLVRSAQGARYLSFVLGLLLFARPGGEAPPAIAAYHARAGSVVMGEAVVLSATLVVMPTSALLLALLRLPAHVLVWRKLGAYGDTLSAAVALALVLAVVSVLVNLVLHACLLAQYRRRSRLVHRRQVRAKAE